MNFKSNKPKRYNEGYSNYPKLIEICANCGYPIGEHYTPKSNDYKDTCPDKEQIKFIRIKPQFFETRKLSDKELMKRKFRKFLYDNDALFAWEKAVKNAHKTLKYVYNKPVIEWIGNAFIWSSNEEVLNLNGWNKLDDKWNIICSK